MRGNELLDKFGNVDPAYIEEADKQPAKKSIKFRWIAAAAVLCLTAGIMVFVLANTEKTPVGNGNSLAENNGPIEQITRYELKAADVASVFDEGKRNDDTNQYKVLYAKTLSELCIEMNSDSEAAYIYSAKENSVNAEQAKNFFDKHLAFANSISGISTTEYRLEKDTDAWGNEVLIGYITKENTSVVDGTEKWSMSSTNFYASGNLFRIGSRSSEPLKIKDTYVSFGENLSDEEIKTSLSELFAYLNENYGTSYSKVRIVRSYNDRQLRMLSVYLCDEETLDNSFAENQKPISKGFIKLDFYSDWGEGTGHDWSQYISSGVILGDVSLYVATESWEILNAGKLLPLNEAEKMLSKGYVFGGHSCPLCMASQEKVDFTDYDAVTLEYVYSNEKKIAIPFYAFYKSLNKKANGIDAFARTYVCAVEVSDLEEYFAEQEKAHNK